MTKEVIGRLTVGLLTVVIWLTGWRPGWIEATIGPVSAAGVRARPLALTCIVIFSLPQIAPATDALSRLVLVALVALTQIGWIVYRSVPTSAPVLPGDSRVGRLAELTAMAIGGAVVGAIVFTIVWYARERFRLDLMQCIGALLGAGCGLVMWESRAAEQLLPVEERP